MNISSEVLFLGLAILACIGVILAYAILILGFCISAAFGLSVFITFCSAMHKFMNDPKEYLEETNTLWLVIISPFHKLERRRRMEFRGASGKLKLTALIIMELLLFLPSLICGAICMTPEVFRETFL